MLYSTFCLASVVYFVAAACRRPPVPIFGLNQWWGRGAVRHIQTEQWPPDRTVSNWPDTVQTDSVPPQCLWEPSTSRPMLV